MSEALEIQFELAFRARGTEALRREEELLSVDPGELVQAAVKMYHERGNADRLCLCVQVLGLMGRHGIEGLRYISQASDEEAQHAFVELAIHASFLSDSERTEFVASFAKSRDFETREKTLSLTRYLTSENQSRVLALFFQENSHV